MNSCCQLDEQLDAVGLNLCFVCRAVAVDLTALGAAVNNDVSLACVGLGANRLHLSAARIGSVARVDVYVQRPEAKRAVVARGKSQRLNLFAAMRANKAAIVFAKAFLFHSRCLQHIIIYFNSNIKIYKSQATNNKSRNFLYIKNWKNLPKSS